MASAGDGGATLEVRGLGFAYGAHHVLDDVALRVGAGEVVGLIGPNGSGKSTVVKLVSGVLAPGRGEIRLWGENAEWLKPRARARRLAVVPQEARFAFGFSALEVVLMGRHPHLGGLTFEGEADIELARRALVEVDARHLEGRSVLELSSGERQRVLFARALAQQPELLLLDEPSSFLDIRHQVALYERVRNLASGRKTAVLTVLHDLNLAAEYCDRVYLLKHGKVAASGPTADVFTYKTLTQVFDTDIYVDVNALTGKLLVAPLPRRPHSQPSDA